MKTLTYVDACVLIDAARGVGDVSRRAMDLLDDPEREYAASEFLRLEVLPKPVFCQKTKEVEFYEAFFAEVQHWARDYEALVADARDEAEDHGLGAMDALHVAAAVQVGAHELITGEKASKPIHRVKSIRVVGIRGDEDGQKPSER